MSRVGWIMLAIFALLALAFGAMFSIGSGTAPTVRVGRAIPSTSGLLVPVAGIVPAALTNTWGDARGGGTRRHAAIDIPAPGGTPVVAAAAGTVEKLFQSEAGGITAYVRSPDRRWSYYYGHLAGYAAGLREGATIHAGDPVGRVGDTGNAGAGNTHLHFAIARMGEGDRWWQGEPVNPYPLLAGSRAER